MEKQSIALVAVSAALVVLAASLTAVVLADNRTLETDDSTISEDILSVTGYAQLTVTPDQLIVYFMVEEKATTTVEALARLSAVSQNVVTTILQKGLNPEDVKTVGLNIRPEYVYKEGQPPEIVGYIAAYTLEVKTKKIAEAGSLIEAAVNAGAYYVNGVYFSLSTEQYGAVYRQLLSAAVTDAETKANALLSPLGLKTIRVKSISIYDAAPIPLARGAVAEEMEGPPVMPGTTTLSVSVNIVFVIGPR